MQLQGWDEVRIYDNTQAHDQTPSVATTLKKTYGEDLLAARITVEPIHTTVVGGQVNVASRHVKTRWHTRVPPPGSWV